MTGPTWSLFHSVSPAQRTRTPARSAIAGSVDGVFQVRYSQLGVEEESPTGLGGTQGHRTTTIIDSESAGRAPSVARGAEAKATGIVVHGGCGGREAALGILGTGDLAEVGVAHPGPTLARSSGCGDCTRWAQERGAPGRFRHARPEPDAHHGALERADLQLVVAIRANDRSGVAREHRWPAQRCRLQLDAQHLESALLKQLVQRDPVHVWPATILDARHREHLSRFVVAAAKTSLLSLRTLQY